MNLLGAVWCLLWFAIVSHVSVSANNGNPSNPLAQSMVRGLNMDFQYDFPTTPAPEFVNCYVEIPSTMRIGGHCVQFGTTGLWSCQSGMHVDLDSDCEDRMRPRRNGRRRNQRRIRRSRTTSSRD